MAIELKLAPGAPFPVTEVVCAVIGIEGDGQPGAFLGTGFFVEPRGLFLTCDHVLAGWPGERYGIAPLKLVGRVVLGEVVRRDPEHDLAVLRFTEHVPGAAFTLGKGSDISLNSLCYCYEYGTSIAAGSNVHLDPSSRIGNVTRVRDMRGRGKLLSEGMLELSFPALLGASGAPVVSQAQPNQLWGVVQGNISVDLLPAHVETIYDDSGKVQRDTKFYMPQALAVNVHWVRKLLASIGSGS